MNHGDVVCFKTTGELCVILGTTASGYMVRRPVMSHENGISHVETDVAEFELETIEEHLRREAKEMLLKTKIQDEMMAELAKAQKDKPVAELVN